MIHKTTSYKLTLTYQGTRYQGWQIQPMGKTIQGELNQALSLVSGSVDVKSMGSGRTDAGVHALNQVVRVDIPLEIQPPQLVRALNVHLPSDVRVKSAEKCEETFHPTFQATSKTYSYYFMKSYDPNPFLENLITSVRYDLDFGLMKEAVSSFKGTHDFKCFQVEGTDVASSVRTIWEADVFRLEALPIPWLNATLNSPVGLQIYEIRFKGNGFLKQMVRLMVGALWAVGRKKITNLALVDALRNPQFGKRLSPVAPPQGLYLHNVTYGDTP
jgi:tRNA pseudouridine38-40 synthase